MSWVEIGQLAAAVLAAVVSYFAGHKIGSNGSK